MATSATSQNWKKKPWCWWQKKKNWTLGAQQTNWYKSHNILPLLYYVNWGYLLLHWEFSWKNNLVHGLSFVGSSLRCHVTCDAKVQLRFRPFRRAVRCTAELWKCPEHCNLEKNVHVSPDSAPEHALMYCPGQHYSIKFGEELVLFAKGVWWSSGVVVLPGKHYLVVQFEQANVKRFQLHNMGKEAERYVGVVSYLLLSIAT